LLKQQVEVMKEHNTICGEATMSRLAEMVADLALIKANTQTTQATVQLIKSEVQWS
jgi:hypothetical protein